MREERFLEELEVKLTDAELATRATDLAHEITFCEERVADLKEYASAEREGIKASESRISKLARAIERGVETRSIECIERPNLEIDQVEIVRLDTSEVVRTRAFESDERQASLFGDEEEEIDSADVADEDPEPDPDLQHDADADEAAANR